MQRRKKTAAGEYKTKLNKRYKEEQKQILQCECVAGIQKNRQRHKKERERKKERKKER